MFSVGGNIGPSLSLNTLELNQYLDILHNGELIGATSHASISYS